ncbi:MAG: hypothetical protein K8T10_00915 [Candidatus Eremiobacteraeota bacterium]|nr:hypothetical protein [Candidatus Eremiobacteraeota bacterium]
MNRVIEQAEKILEGVGNPDELHSKLIELDRAVNYLMQVFKQESKFQEKTDFFNKESDILKTKFEKLKHGIKRIFKYFKKPENRYIVEGVDKSIKAFEDLFASFDRLKEEESRRKVYSESPYLNDVIRISRCVKKGTLPAEVFKERLEMFLNIQLNLQANIENLHPTQDERPIFEENKEKVEENIKRAIEGLKLAKTYFITHMFESVEAGLEKARVAIDFLMKFEKKLKEAREAPKVKYCFRCSTENPRSVRFCINCNYNFPPLQMEEESTFDVRLEEGGIKQIGHVMTQNLMKLYEVVDKMKTRSISVEKYLETVNWFKGLMLKAREDEKKIQPPETKGDSEAQEAFEQFKENFDIGMKDVEDGVNRLLIFAETEDPNLLETGMESILRGGDRLYQVKMIGDQVKMAMEQAVKQAKK